MKKKLAVLMASVLVLMMVVPLTTAFAYAGGLLNGKALTVSTTITTADSGTTLYATDNNNTSYWNLGRQYLYYTFASPVTINAYQINAVLRGSSNLSLYFFDESGSVISSIASLQLNKTSVKTSITPVSGVKKVAVYNGHSSDSAEVYEFDVFTAPNYSGGLLDNKSIYLTDHTPLTDLTQPKTGMTDNNEATSYVWPSGNYLFYQFSSDVNVTGFRAKFTSSGNVKVVFVNSSQQDISSTTSTGTGSLEPVTLTGVRYVRLLSTTGVQVTMQEFNVYGSVPDITPPAAPTGFISTASDAIKGTYSMGWAANTESDMKEYQLWQNGSLLVTLPKTSTAYMATGLQAGQTYQFVLKAVDTAGNVSTNSNTLSFTMPKPPTKPTGLFATALPIGEKIELQWLANPAADDVAGYIVYRDGEKMATVSRTLAVISAEANKEYTYTVTAYNSVGLESEKSEGVKATALVTPDTTPPDEPKSLKAVGLEGKIQLSWNKSTASDVDGYFIYRNGTRINAEPITTNSFEVLGGTWGTLYRFQVTAVDKSGNESGKSNEATATLLKPSDTTPPAKPTGLTAAITSDAMFIKLNWGAVTDNALAGYNVYVSSDGVGYEKLNAASVKETTFLHPYNEGNLTFYFQVTAVDEAGNESKPSNTVKIKTPTRVPDGEVNPTKPSLIVSWEAITGATAYLIYYDGNLVANVGTNVLQYEIKANQGYDPNNQKEVVIKAKFIDGSVGQDATKSGNWGINPLDLVQSSMAVVASLAGFFLLGVVIALFPRILRMVRAAIRQRRGYQ
ncbi:fibronectin type III domain-containing protein [Paenibacillus sp. MMO-177]|uniref:fibronectin type III domain-containing protein n=1 Tax=Paenibacillus sp. MMO-177 TaxID=3081289 RepID=UPI003016A315